MRYLLKFDLLDLYLNLQCAFLHLWQEAEVGGLHRKRKLLYCLGQACRLQTLRVLRRATSVAVQQACFAKTCIINFVFKGVFQLSSAPQLFPQEHVDRMHARVCWQCGSRLLLISSWSKMLVCLVLRTWLQGKILLLLVSKKHLWKSWRTCAWATRKFLFRMLGFCLRPLT